MNDRETVLQSYAKRRTIGKFLMDVEKEYQTFEGPSSFAIDTPNVSYKIVNNRMETINFFFKFYKTAWALTITSDGGYNSKLGKFPAKTNVTFNTSLALGDFLDSCKYLNNLPKNGSSVDYRWILSKVWDECLKLIELNFSCMFNHTFNNSKLLAADIIENFNPDTSDPIVALMKLFGAVDKCLNDDIVKDLCLYCIAKKVFEIKYQMYGSDNATADIKGFDIQATSQEIAYAHALQFYGGKCKWLHGHNGKLVIKATVSSDTLKTRPMFLSYGFLKKFLKYMDGKLDHKTFWALNPESKYTFTQDGSMRVNTEKQSIIFHDTEGHVVFPCFGDSSPYSTSEVTLKNYVIPQFMIFFMRFFLSNDGPDSTNMAFCDISEMIKYTFFWYETENTVCSMYINC